MFILETDTEYLYTLGRTGTSLFADGLFCFPGKALQFLIQITGSVLQEPKRIYISAHYIINENMIIIPQGVSHQT